MNLRTRAFLKARRILLQRTTKFRSPARVAIIGCGRIAPDHFYGFQEAGNAVVVAASDIRPDALAQSLKNYPRVRAYRNVRKMLQEVRPEIVDICTWPDSHLEMVQAAVEAGARGIICEKPLALTMAEVDKIISLCDSARIKFGVGHQYRFHSNFIKAAALIRERAIGAVREVQGNIADSIANNGPHLVDTIRFVLGDAPATSVTLQCERVTNSFNRGWPVEDSATGEITFSNGVTARINTGTRSPSFFHLHIKGEKGTIDVDTEELKVNDRPVATGDSATNFYMCRRKQFGDFVDWTKGKAPGYLADGESSARTAELVLALYESARLSNAVTLPLLNKGDVIRQLYAGSKPETVSEPIAQPAPIPENSALAMDGGVRSVEDWYEVRPDIGIDEFIGTTKVLLSRQLGSTAGNVVRTLEKEFARVYGSPLSVASTSGTASLHVAVAAVNPEPYEEIITTPMTDMGSVIPILFANCIPVFADIDPISGNLTAATIAAKITPQTRAVIVVHLFGRPADLNPIRELLKGKGIALIEDCSQAHYADYEGKKVGSIGDMGCFSLQQTKHITCGDGGLTLVNNEAYADRARLFVDKGWDRGAGKRTHRFLGLNYRMTELQGAVALAQVKKLPRLIQSRQATAGSLFQRLSTIPGIVLPAVAANTHPAWWIFNFVIDQNRIPIHPDVFCDALQVEGVRVSRNYLPRPLFEEEMFTGRHLFGTHGHPFKPDFQMPRMEAFPGLREFFERQMIIFWSSTVREAHVIGMAEAVRKLATGLTR